MPAVQSSAPSGAPGARILRVRPIEAAAYEAYGRLIEPPPEAVRINRVARFADDRPAATANIAVVRSQVAHFPLVVREMERHPHSDQIFVPLDARRYLVVVARNGEDGRPDASTLAAFLVRHPIGISYFPSTWHINMVCVGETGSFCLLIHEAEAGMGQDCIFSPVEDFTIVLGTDQPA